jgi:hypothetical protein
MEYTNLLSEMYNTNLCEKKLSAKSKSILKVLKNAKFKSDDENSDWDGSPEDNDWITMDKDLKSIVKIAGFDKKDEKKFIDFVDEYSDTNGGQRASYIVEDWANLRKQGFPIDDLAKKYLT